MKKLRFFRSTPPLKKFFFKYFRFRYAHAVFTVVLPDDWRIFLVTCIMSLRRTVWPQFNFQVTFSHFFPTPPSNMASRRHFPEIARHRDFNRRRREHGDTLFCNKIFVASSRNSVIPKIKKKYRFQGENYFFSPPCVTPLGSVCKFWSCTRPGLPGKKNRKSIGQ